MSSKYKVKLVTLCHTIQTFKNSEKEAFLKHCGKKEKMLETSIFTYSHNVFYPSCFKLHIYFVIRKCFQLDQSKSLLFGTEVTLYHTIPTFNDPEKGASSKHCGKRRKMLVTSIFLLFPQCFSQNKFQFFSHIYLIVCKCFQFGPV